MNFGRNRELRETREKDQTETVMQPSFGSFPPFAYLACFAVKKNEPRYVGCYEFSTDHRFPGLGSRASRSVGWLEIVARADSPQSRECPIILVGHSTHSRLDTSVMPRHCPFLKSYGD